MKLYSRTICFFSFFFIFCPGFIYPLDYPKLSSQEVNELTQQTLRQHVIYRTITTPLAKNLMVEYFDLLDKDRNYFLHSEVETWLTPEKLNFIVESLEKGNFDFSGQILRQFTKAIVRRRAFLSKALAKIKSTSVSDDVAVAPIYKGWAYSPDEIILRICALRTRQLHSLGHLPRYQRDAYLAKLDAQRTHAEDQFTGATDDEQNFCSRIWFLKALGRCLDAHTSYLTPKQLEQLSIAIQQRFKGVGLHLCEQLKGFSVLKIVQGSPADRCQDLFVGDLITAIDGESIAGLEIDDISQRIRGLEGSQVLLTVVKGGDFDEKSKIVPLTRESIVVQEGRFQTAEHPFGKETVGIIKLNAFYEDDDTSSSEDLAKELKALQDPSRLNPMAALILDLRENSGGLLPQAVEVVGLFIKRGVVVSVKDGDGKVHHVRNLSAQPLWQGPLIVLTSRASASGAEIVAQALQDFGRAIVVGDDRTYGKGTFQTLSINHTEPNPKGAFKVTRGRYYTTSGKSPQKIGVLPDIEVPGPLSALPVGETFAKYCIDSDQIPSTFHFPVDDLPLPKREILRQLYSWDLQEKIATFQVAVPQLRENSQRRMLASKAYQGYLSFLQTASDKQALGKAIDVNEQIDSLYDLMDLQLLETLNIAKDLVLIHRHRTEMAQR